MRLEALGHTVDVMPAKLNFPRELSRSNYDMVFNHALCFPSDKMRNFAEQNPEICVVNMNHSSLCFLEYTARLLREYTSAIWTARSLDNVWLVNQDDNGVGKATGCERIMQFKTPAYNIERREKQTLGDVVRVVLAGRPSPIKNYYNQLVALKQMGDRVEIHMCCNPTKEMEFFMKALKIRAVGHGLIPHTKWINFLKKGADIVLQPALAESYNYVATEAQQCGVPVVAGASVRAADPEITVADPNSVPQIVEAIEHTIETYDERQDKAVFYGQKSAEDQNAGYDSGIKHIIDYHNKMLAYREFT